LLSMMSANGGCAPQELLALQDGPSSGSSTGQHGSSNQLVSRCKGAMVLTNGEVQLEALLCGLPADIIGHIFLFGNLSDVKNCVGVCSRELYEGVWQQPEFWMALGGPVFLENFEFPKKALDVPIDPSAATITGFRRWVYGLDGAWIEELERLAQDESPVTLLEEALNRIQGLRPEDVCNGEIWRVVQVIVQAMQHLQPAHGGTDVAVNLVECCDRSQDVFNNSQLSSLKSELGNFQERVLQQQLWSTEDPEDEKALDPWSLDSWSLDLDDYSPNSKPLTGVYGGHQGRCLQMGFLAVMDESNLVEMTA